MSQTAQTTHTPSPSSGELLASPCVVAVQNRYVAATAETGAQCGPLVSVLTRQWGTDAHFSQYTASRRMRAEDIGSQSIELQIIALDCDAPNHIATDKWRAAFDAAVQALDATHPGAVAYHTRGGGRIVYRLPAPVAIASLPDAHAWRQRYLATVAYFEGFGLTCDPACSEWQRIYRAPFVVRDGQPTNPEALGALHGDPGAIGVLDVALTPDRYARAAELCPAAFDVTATPTGTPPGEGLVLYTPGGPERAHGRLFDALDASGAIVYWVPRAGGFEIRCPREAEHSPGPDHTRGAMYFPPDMPSADGRIVCKHDGCSRLTHADWLRALGLGTAVESAITVTIRDAYPDSCRSGVRVVLRLVDDSGAELDYLRVYPGGGRWDALWSAAGVAPPTDLESDFLSACCELEGKRVQLMLRNGIPVKLLETGE